MVECVVEYEYAAQEEDELTIRPGDVITNVQKMDGGWWEGEVGGKKGMFPDNFVKELKPEAKKIPQESNHRASVKKAGGGGGHVAELANRLGKEGAIRIGPPAPGALKRETSQGKRQQRVKVTFSYSPENDDELRLEVGDVLTVTKQEEEGWWEGILNGKTGMFPSNFVEVIEEDSGDASGEELNTPEGEVIEIHGKKVKGVGLGNIFSAGPIKLRSTGSKDQPSAVKRTPTSPKNQPPKEPIPRENNEKRESMKRGTAPTEPPPSLPPKDQHTVKPFENSYEYAVPYQEPDEDNDTTEPSNGRSFSPGAIVEDGAISAKTSSASQSSDFSLPQLDVASPESSCSLEFGKSVVLSPSGSGRLSARSENASDDVPYELSALSQTRHTPPPRFTQFNFRKRRSRGTPKNSPKINVVLVKDVIEKKQQLEKPPKKVAKLVGTEDAIVSVAAVNTTALEMASTESQTDAQYVEDKETVNLMPQNVIIKAFARSRSEPCLTIAKKSVSFVTRDNYISDGDDSTEMTPVSEGAKKRMSRAKRRFPSKGMIDGSKITDSLKLLRVRMGMDPDGTHTEGAEPAISLNNEIEVKTKHKKLTTIKNKIRKIASSPARNNNKKETETDRSVTALSNVNIGDTGIKVTEDNCSTTALRGSPLSTRSSSLQEITDPCSKVMPQPLNESNITAETVAAAARMTDPKPCHDTPPSHKLPFFTFSLGRKKSQKNKVENRKAHEDQAEEKNINLNDLNEIKSEHLPEKSYFQALDNMGKMSPAIKNISNKYRLFTKGRAVVAPQDLREGNSETPDAMIKSRKDSDLFPKPFQNFFNEDQRKQVNESPTHAVQLDKYVCVEETKLINVNGTEEPDAGMARPEREKEPEEVIGTYAPNEGDQHKPLIKRTKKSTNVAVDKDELMEVRKPNAKKPSTQRKPLKKSRSITQRLRRIWSSRDKLTKSEQSLETEGGSSKESAVIDGNSPREVETKDRRDNLMTHSDTVTGQTSKNETGFPEDEMLASKSAGTLAYPISAASSNSDEGNRIQILSVESPRNVNQNCENVPMDAIFTLQNFVHSFTQSETDVYCGEAVTNQSSVQNVEPQIKRKELPRKVVQLSGSSTTSITEPCLESENANLEFPVLNSESSGTQGWVIEVEDVDMDVVNQNGRKFKEFGKDEPKPRRICPTRVPVQDELMQTDPDADKDDVFETEPQKCYRGRAFSSQSGPHSICEVSFQQDGESVQPHDRGLDSVVKKRVESKDKEHSVLQKPRFKYEGTIDDAMDTDILDAVGSERSDTAGRKPNGKRKAVAWNRCNSAPPGKLDPVENKASSFTRWNTSALDVNDSSLDKWDMMKLMLQETEAIYFEEFGNLNLESPRPVAFGDKQVQRPFNYDESCSAESSASTNSAIESKDMETGDVESGALYVDGRTASSSCGSQAPEGAADFMNKSFVALRDDPYGSAPVPSPSEPNESFTTPSRISVSNLSDSLSRLEALTDKGGSGEKRKQSEVATPTKDENRSRKVRLESPESDEEGPPRARRVLRSDKT